MNLGYWCLLWLLSSLCCSLAWSIDQPKLADSISPHAEQILETNAELITINMRQADIVSVIQWIAEQTHKKIVVDPRVRGKVNILANVPMTVEQAYHVFLAMLDVYGYSAVENNDIVRIIPSSAAKASPSSIITDFQNDKASQQALYIYEAKNVATDKISNVLKPLVASSGYINHIPGSNKLIIADAYNNIHRLISLIEQIDQETEVNIQVIKLQYASSATVAAVITSLLESDKGNQFTIASDERSNSVLMTGDTLIEKRVKQLIQQLDKPILSNDNTKVIYLHYTDAEEMLPILNNMSAALQKENKNQNTQEQAINVSASSSTNAIIVTAPPDILYAMEKVISQIDIQRAQVLVEAIIVEVSDELSQKLGVEWNTSFSAGTGTEAATSFGLRVADGDSSSILSTGLSLGYYSGGSLRALINALATEVDANILSTPSLMTLDNQEAEVLVGSNVPFITGQSLGKNNSSKDPFTTISRQDIGLSLKVTPQINDGRSVTLDIVQELETLNDSVNGAQDLVTNKRSIKTKVLVKNDTTLVLGGLITDETKVLVNKVPLLGDIPLIGALFRSTSTQTLQRHLMIFIHPQIITDSMQASSLSNDKYQHMQNIRKQYQNEKGDITVK